MAKSSSSYDFRRWRHKLYDWEFAISPTRPKPPIELRVDKETWEGIIGLPDDVSLRTSDYHGPELALARSNANKWWDLLDESERYPLDSPLSAYFIEGYAEPEASIFNSLCGYYRQAGSSLRYMLEAVLAGMYFSASLETQLEYKRHSAGDPSVGMPFLGSFRQKLYTLPNFQRFNAWLVQNGQPPCLGHDPDGCLRRIYDELTEFAHGRMAVLDANGQLMAFGNVGMWESTGPVFRQDQFLRWFDLLCTSVFCCGALIRIYLIPSSAPDPIFLNGLRATTNLYLTDNAKIRVRPFRDFLEETFPTEQ